jgi:hypothetical protein
MILTRVFGYIDKITIWKTGGQHPNCPDSQKNRNHL